MCTVGTILHIGCGLATTEFFHSLSNKHLLMSETQNGKNKTDSSPAVKEYWSSLELSLEIKLCKRNRKTGISIYVEDFWNNGRRTLQKNYFLTIRCLILLWNT